MTAPARQSMSPTATATPTPATHTAWDELLAVLGELAAWRGDPDDPANRDPTFIRRLLPLAHAIDWLGDVYFRKSIDGENHIPDEQFIAVGNHGGGPLLPDVAVMMAWWAVNVGVDRPIYFMAHDFGFRLPVLRGLFAKIGVLPACRTNADKVLRAGAALVCYPGGELDCLRPFRDRNRITLHGRTGFVELAYRYGLPIVPFVNAGGHEVYVTLTEGRNLARWTGLTALTRVKALPLNLGLPWGVWLSGFLPYLPLPAKLAYRVAPPLRLPRDPALAGDRAAVRRVYWQVVGTMQDMLDELAAGRRFPVLG